MSLTPNIQVEDLWQFSLETYAKTGVSELCLLLQNEFDINVNLLLLTTYLDEQALSLDDSQWPKLEACIFKINNSLKVLRQARTLINEINIEVYDKVLIAELELEKQTQQILVNQLNSVTICPNQVASNLFRFLEFKGVALASDLVTKFHSLSSPNAD